MTDNEKLIKMRLSILGGSDDDSKDEIFEMMLDNAKVSP